MTYREAFPEIEASKMPPIPDGWVDISWRGARCPRNQHPETAQMSSLKPSTARTIEEAETAAKASGTQRFDLPSGNRLFVQWQPTHSAHAYHLEIMRTGDGYSCGRDGAQKALETMSA